MCFICIIYLGYSVPLSVKTENTNQNHMLKFYEGKYWFQNKEYIGNVVLLNHCIEIVLLFQRVREFAAPDETLEETLGSSRGLRPRNESVRVHEGNSTFYARSHVPGEIVTGMWVQLFIFSLSFPWWRTQVLHLLCFLQKCLKCKNKNFIEIFAFLQYWSSIWVLEFYLPAFEDDEVIHVKSDNVSPIFFDKNHLKIWQDIYHNHPFLNLAFFLLCSYKILKYHTKSCQDNICQCTEKIACACQDFSRKQYDCKTCEAKCSVEISTSQYKIASFCVNLINRAFVHELVVRNLLLFIDKMPCLSKKSTHFLIGFHPVSTWNLTIWVLHHWYQLYLWLQPRYLCQKVCGCSG